MKLTDITINNPAVRGHVHLQGLSGGLNVVTSPSTTAGDTIAHLIAWTFFGDDPAHSPSLCGSLFVDSGGHQYRLNRSGTGSSEKLAVSDISGNGLNDRTPRWLSSMDRETWQLLYCLPSNHGHDPENAGLLSRLLNQFELDRGAVQDAGTGMPFAPDPSGFEAWRSRADERKKQLDSLRGELDQLQSQRRKFPERLDGEDRERRDQLESAEHELSVLQTNWNALQLRRQTDQTRLAKLDAEIRQINSQIDPLVSPIAEIPSATLTTSLLVSEYERLDEIDEQIARWQSVQQSIQNVRLQLRDELIANGQSDIERSDHPCHDARNILSMLETRLNKVDRQIHKLVSSHSSQIAVGELDSLSAEIRTDLQALCNELSRQFTHVRHRSVVGELKQLRRCYHELQENVRQLSVRREELIASLRIVDPAGADAIVRADRQFLADAREHGYLVARNRFVTGGIPVKAVSRSNPAQELNLESSRFQERQESRSELASGIARLDVEMDEILRRREFLAKRRDELNSQVTVEHRSHLREFENHRETLERELLALENQVQSDRLWYNWKPDYYLANATRYLASLTNGRWTQISFDQRFHCLIGAPGRMSESLNVVAQVDRSLARLSLCLAAVSQLALRGIRLPMVVSDETVEEAGDALFSTLDAFCRDGHQVILATAGQRIEHAARRHGMAIFELPDCEIISPVWSPDDSPRIPFPDPGNQVGDNMASAPWRANPMANNYPVPDNQTIRPLGNAEFPQAPVSTFASSIQPTGFGYDSGILPVRRDTLLEEVDLVESIYLHTLALANVDTVGQLIDLDPDRDRSELVRRGFTTDQIQRWQSQAWIQLTIPHMRADHAKVLVACGIAESDSIQETASTQIRNRIRQYLDSPGGRGIRVAWEDFPEIRIENWMRQLLESVSWKNLWAPTRDAQSDNRRPRERAIPRAASYRSNHNEATPDSRKRGPTLRESAVADSAQPVPQISSSEGQCFLKGSDGLNAVPTIGPKTAQQFTRAGIHTVDDFLAADVIQVAAELDNRRLSAKILGNWQDQTRLLCRVPDLQGHDARILVACGIREPETLAKTNAEFLLETVTKFIATREGERLVRNTGEPDLVKITQWIESAQRSAVRAA